MSEKMSNKRPRVSSNEDVVANSLGSSVLAHGLSRVFDNMGSPVVAFTDTADMKIVYANDATAVVFEYDSRDDLMGESVNVLLAAQDQMDLRVHKNAGSVMIEGRSKSGRLLNLQASLTQDEEEIGAALTAVFIDMTDMYFQLSRTNRMLASMAAPVVEVDNDMKITYVNSETERIFGYKASELQGQQVTMLMNEHDAMNHDSYVHRLRSTGHTRVIGKKPRLVDGITKAGEQLKLKLTLTSSSSGFTAVFTDVTMEFKQKELLKRIYANLTTPLAICSHEDFQIKFANSTCERVFGVEKNGLEGVVLTDLFPDSNVNVSELIDAQIMTLVNGRRKCGMELKLYFSIARGLDNEYVVMFTDVTTQYLVERNTHEILSSMASPVVVCNPDMRITFVNHNALIVFGYEMHELLGENVTKLMNRDDATRHDDYVNRFRSTGSSKIIGKRPRLVDGVHKDGSVLKLYLTITTTLEGGFTAVFTDVTGQHRLADQTISILSSMVSPVVICDQYMHINYVNKAAEQVFGYTSEELANHNVTVFMTQRDAAHHDEAVNHYRKTGQTKIIGKPARLVEGRHKNGSSLKLYLSVTSAEGGGFVGVFTDVTKLERQEERMRNILSSMASPVIVSDSKMNMTFVNQNALEVFGYEHDELIGHNVRMLMTLDESGQHDEYVHRFRTTGKSKIIGKRPRLVNGRHKDGSTLILYLTITDAGDGGYTAVFTDITEQHRQAERMQKAIADTQLDKAKAEARADAERSLNDYIAHEVRNPLSVAISAAHFVSNSSALTDIQNDELRRSSQADMDLIHSSLSYISELLGNMLDLNKFLHNGSQRFKVSTISILNDVLIPVKSMLHRRTGQVVLCVDCSDELWVETDGLRLKQVVVNLAKNSIKFVERGYIKLVAYRSLVDESKVIIAVEDSGPGIPPAQRTSLFEKFQESLDMLRQGTGVGLCLVKAIVEALGGSIRLDDSYHSSVKGCPGARFEVEVPLPAVQPPSGIITDGKGVNISGASSSCSAQTMREMQGKALIVDDDAIVRKMITRRLQKLCPHMEFFEAASGEVCAQMVLQDPHGFTFVVIDQYMPGPSQTLTGEDTIRLLRNKGITITLLGCSANDMADIHMAAGADGFLRKPLVKDSQLVQTIMEALRLPSHLQIALVDDEQINRIMLKRFLVKMAPACNIVEFSTGHEIVPKLMEINPDIVVLDEHLGAGPSGSDIAAELRSAGSDAVLVSVSGDLLNCSSSFDIMWSKPLPSAKEMKRHLRLSIQERKRVKNLSNLT